MPFFHCPYIHARCERTLAGAVRHREQSWTSRPSLAREANFDGRRRSEEHTSELQSQFQLVCRLLLEKKKRLRSTAGRDPAVSQALPPSTLRAPRGGARLPSRRGELLGERVPRVLEHHRRFAAEGGVD